eukprot:jgi/Mesvir1/13411/Mv16495-RA.1
MLNGGTIELPRGEPVIETAAPPQPSACGEIVLHKSTTDTVEADDKRNRAGIQKRIAISLGEKIWLCDHKKDTKWSHDKLREEFATAHDGKSPSKAAIVRILKSEKELRSQLASGADLSNKRRRREQKEKHALLTLPSAAKAQPKDSSVLHLTSLEAGGSLPEGDAAAGASKPAVKAAETQCTGLDTKTPLRGGSPVEGATVADAALQATILSVPDALEYAQALLHFLTENPSLGGSASIIPEGSPLQCMQAILEAIRTMPAGQEPPVSPPSVSPPDPALPTPQEPPAAASMPASPPSAGPVELVAPAVQEPDPIPAEPMHSDDPRGG